jgi:hypothetical protein
MGTWEHKKLSKLPWHNNALGFFFWWARSLKIHRNKKGVVLWYS